MNNIRLRIVSAIHIRRYAIPPSQEGVRVECEEIPPHMSIRAGVVHLNILGHAGANDIGPMLCTTWQKTRPITETLWGDAE